MHDQSPLQISPPFIASSASDRNSPAPQLLSDLHFSHKSRALSVASNRSHIGHIGQQIISHNLFHRPTFTGVVCEWKHDLDIIWIACFICNILISRNTINTRISNHRITIRSSLRHMLWSQLLQHHTQHHDRDAMQTVLVHVSRSVHSPHLIRSYAFQH